MDITRALETGSIGYILMVFGAISIAVLWRQNVFLTKELLKITERLNQTLSDLKLAIMTKKD